MKVNNEKLIELLKFTKDRMANMLFLRYVADDWLKKNEDIESYYHVGSIVLTDTELKYDIERFHKDASERFPGLLSSIDRMANVADSLIKNATAMRKSVDEICLMLEETDK